MLGLQLQLRVGRAFGQLFEQLLDYDEILHGCIRLDLESHGFFDRITGDEVLAI